MPVADSTLPVLDLSATSVELTRVLCDIESVSGNERAIADAIEASLAGFDHLELFRDGDALVARTSLGRDKRVVIALTYIYGVGPNRSKDILAATEISHDIRVKDLSDDQLIQLRDYIEGTYKVEGDLRREVAADIRRKIEIGSYQGIRHRRGLPVHGQRTKTNARTRKGPKRTVAGKKKAR